MSATLWALGRLDVATPADTAAALLAAAEAHAPAMTRQAVANTLWGCAALGLHPSAALVDALLKQLVYQSRSLDACAIASALLSLSKLDVRLTGEPRAVLLGAAGHLAERMSPLEVANTLLALSRFGLEAGDPPRLRAALGGAYVETRPAMAAAEERMAAAALTALGWADDLPEGPLHSNLPEAVERWQYHALSVRSGLQLQPHSDWPEAVLRWQYPGLSLRRLVLHLAAVFGQQLA